MNFELGAVFLWFVGFVEDRDDPDQLGRVKVRMVGLSDEITTEHLHWARVSLPTTSASHQGIGVSPTGISVGSMVMGFFMDGPHKQMPIITHTFYGAIEGDISGYVTGNKSISKGTDIFEPTNPAKPQYPFNKVMTTESGHVIEYDDTPGAERLHFYHKSGSYHEVGPDGQRVIKTVGDSYEIDVANKTIYVKGDLTLRIDGNVNAEIKGTVDINGNDTIKINAPSIEING